MKIRELIEVRSVKEAEISREQDEKMAKVLDGFLFEARKDFQGKMILFFSEDGFDEDQVSFPSLSVGEVMEKGEIKGLIKIIKVKDVVESKEALFACIDESGKEHLVLSNMILAFV